MHALLSIALMMIGLSAPLAPPAAPAASEPSVPAPPAASDPLPLVAVACPDSLDFFLLLDDPGVQTQIVGIADCGAFTMVTAVHTVEDATLGTYAWGAIYTFPSTIFAHSIVSVRWHAEEME